MKRKSTFLTDEFFISCLLKQKFQLLFVCFLIIPFSLLSQEITHDASPVSQDGIVLKGGAQILENNAAVAEFESPEVEKKPSQEKLLTKKQEKQKVIPAKSKSPEKITKKIPQNKVKQQFQNKEQTGSFAVKQQRESCGIFICSLQIANLPKSFFIRSLSLSGRSEIFSLATVEKRNHYSLWFSVRPPPVFL